MFTPDQITTAIAVNAIADPKSELGQLLKLIVDLDVDPHDLMLDMEEVGAQLEKMMRKAVMADGVISKAEQPAIDFLEQLKVDTAKQERLSKNIKKLLYGVAG